MQLHYHTLWKSDKWSPLTLTLADKRSVPWGGVGRGLCYAIPIWVTDNKRKLKCICSYSAPRRTGVRRPVGDIAFSSFPFLLPSIEAPPYLDRWWSSCCDFMPAKSSCSYTDDGAPPFPLSCPCPPPHFSFFCGLRHSSWENKEFNCYGQIL